MELDGKRRAVATRIFKGREDRARFRGEREKRIEEAVSWEAGPSPDNPRRYVMGSLGLDLDIYFLKPGKETLRRNGNPHDMLPCVGEVYNRKKFDDLWVIMSRVFSVDFDLFKRLLMLVYRNAFHIDHVLVEDRVRYSPDKDVQKCIEEIDARAGEVLPPGGALGLLHFLDLLGWNEDVKYHAEDGSPTFSGRFGYNVGRVNTLLTCIGVTYPMCELVGDIRDAPEELGDAYFRPAYELMQKLLRSRGTCTPTQAQLKDWLSPYLREQGTTLVDF